MTERKMCSYCAKWFDQQLMRQLPDDDYNWYCPRCYSEVAAAVAGLPWHKRW